MSVEDYIEAAGTGLLYILLALFAPLLAPFALLGWGIAAIKRRYNRLQKKANETEWYEEKWRDEQKLRRSLEDELKRLKQEQPK